TALKLTYCFLICPYGPSCFNSLLVGGVLYCTMTSTGKFKLVLGRSGAVFVPARTTPAAAISVKILKKCFMALFRFPLKVQSPQTALPRGSSTRTRCCLCFVQYRSVD